MGNCFFVRILCAFMLITSLSLPEKIWALDGVCRTRLERMAELMNGALGGRVLSPFVASPNGTRYANSTLGHIFNLRSGKVVEIIPDPSSIERLAFDGDNNVLVTRRTEAPPTLGPEVAVQEFLRFSGDDAAIYWGDFHGNVHKMVNGKAQIVSTVPDELPDAVHNQVVTGIDSSGSGAQLLVRGDRGFVRLLTPLDRRGRSESLLLPKPILPGQNLLHDDIPFYLSAVWSNDGGKVIAVSDGGVHLFEVNLSQNNVSVTLTRTFGEPNNLGAVVRLYLLLSRQRARLSWSITGVLLYMTGRGIKFFPLVQQNNPAF